MGFKDLVCCFQVGIGETENRLRSRYNYVNAWQGNICANLDPLSIEFTITKYFIDRRNGVSTNGRPLLFVDKIITD